MTSNPSAESHGQEIDDELLFHFHSMVDENLAAGMSLDAAWANAQRRFGSLRKYSEACQVASGWKWFSCRPTFALLAMLLIIGAFLFQVQVQAVWQQQRALDIAERAQANAAAALAQATAPIAVAHKAGAPKDLTGSVKDADERAIEKATILVIRKTWPKGRYRQENYHATTDKEGKFRIKNLVPDAGQYAFQVAAVLPGYALASDYQLIQESDDVAMKPIELQLSPAVPLTVTLKDAEGKPLPHTKVIPFQRQSPDGAENGVYFQAAKPIELITDANGEVALPYFAGGDAAQIYVRLPGKDWQEQQLQVPDQGGRVDLTVR